MTTGGQILIEKHYHSLLFEVFYILKLIDTRSEPFPPKICLNC